MISGRCEDVEAADSNGAGKSALVMAPAWALTGRSDARAEVRLLGSPWGTSFSRPPVVTIRCMLLTTTLHRRWQGRGVLPTEFAYRLAPGHAFRHQLPV